jgi:ubiquinone/menaquinone biosynthesis C-methylase UbiE
LTNALNKLSEVLAEDRTARLVEDDIYSVLPDDSRTHHYDKRAGVYDLVVSTRLYNLVMWGTSPSDYVDFARLAFTSSSDGIFLDAGCGSMLFTATHYVQSKRCIIAVDESLAMLRRARQRLIKLCGHVPEHVRLVQTDLNDLPFRPKSFNSVLCLNVLHQFSGAAALISNLKQLLTGDGDLYLTSLILNKCFVGDHYLNALYAAGEFVRPRSKHELEEILKTSFRVKGNMAFAVTARY